MEVIGPSTGPLRSPEQVATLTTLGGPSFPISVSAGCLYPHPGYTLASFAVLSKKTSAWVSSPETLTQSVAGPRRQPRFSAPGGRPVCSLFSEALLLKVWLVGKQQHLGTC